MELLKELQRKNNELTISIKELRKNGTALAEAERDYKMKLTQEVLKLKSEKMPATLIDIMVYGVPEVAEKRFKRDVADAMYNANKEHINVTKLQLKIIQAQLDKEWTNAERMSD